MIKTEEARKENSCWNKAADDERLFILLSRDKAAPETIEFWCKRRIEMGLNTELDPQIEEALMCAKLMRMGS